MPFGLRNRRLQRLSRARSPESWRAHVRSRIVDSSFVSRLPAVSRSEVRSVLARFQHTNRRLSGITTPFGSPRVLGDNPHPLSDRDSRKLGGSTKRSVAFLISFYRE